MSKLTKSCTAAFFAAIFVSNAIAGNSSTFGEPQTVNTAHHVDKAILGDFDGDGVPDVAVLGSAFVSGNNTGQVEVRFGDGAGGFRGTGASFTFTDSNTDYRGMAAADLDGDGHSELIFASGDAVLIYDWDGTAFTQATSIDLTASGIEATVVAVGNLTRHPGEGTPGSQDIVVSDDFGSVGVVWIPNDGAGTFGTPVKSAAHGCDFYSKPVLADVDGDGLDDVVLSHSPTVGVLINKGDGTLDAEDTYPSTQAGFQTRAVTVGDLDDDGHPDLIALGYAHDSNTLKDTYYFSVNLSLGNGTFADGHPFLFPQNKTASMLSALPRWRRPISMGTDAWTWST